MIPVDALLFDLDGTLIDSKRDLYLSVRHVQSALGRKAGSEKQIASYVGNGVVKLIQRALPGLEGDRLTRAVGLFKRRYHRHCLDHTRLYPGVAETLERFRHKPLAVVTNKPLRVSRYILDALGLGNRFSIVLGGDSLRRKKPHPSPVLHVLAELKIRDPRRVLMVGDGANDIEAGRAAGTRTCGMLSNIGDGKGLRASRPDILLTRMTELMEWVV